MISRTIMTVIMAVLFNMAVLAQEPAPSPTPKPVKGIWMQLRVQEGINHEAGIKKLAPDEAQSRSTVLSGEYKDYYWVTDWGINCKTFEIREIRVNIYDPSNKLVKTNLVMGPWNKAEKGFDDKTHSLGYIALRDFWCEQ
jgi:hypothetical protein